MEPSVKYGKEYSETSVGNHMKSIKRPSKTTSHARYLTESASMQSAVSHGMPAIALTKPINAIEMRIRSVERDDINVFERGEIHRETDIDGL